ncbi:anti-sigma factor [Corynebacterium epidermidicanis]|uniref:Putative DUF2337 family protein n=1 Tax=Corynebacterium epidermidicanis TaxID=1050174 RepID=A0A0G3GSZ1_9CORY|nr:anti-sigma factor [Corynebacterium epidermidicanis]AKK01982.1 putative DUF2337 family protein [Corynebacterium epidermidicanis]
MTDINFPKDLDAALARATTPQTPRPELKEQLMAAIAAEQDAKVVSIDSAKPKRRWRSAFLATAAAVTIFAGSLTWMNQSEPDSHDQMHSIMAASDVRQAKTQAMGAQLDIVVSSSMGKGGAMVDGAPDVDKGMGAQVWAVMADGSMKSAGVIGPEPHDSVWMPLPGETMKVMITEEPVGGSAQPSGTVLAEAEL